MSNAQTSPMQRLVEHARSRERPCIEQYHLAISEMSSRRSTETDTWLALRDLRHLVEENHGLHSLDDLIEELINQ